jgi:hypothetical protein
MLFMKLELVASEVPSAACAAIDKDNAVTINRMFFITRVPLLVWSVCFGFEGFLAFHVLKCKGSEAYMQKSDRDFCDALLSGFK